MKKFLFILLSCILMTAGVAFANSVTLEWSPNSESDLVGYRAFTRVAGADYDYTIPTWEGTATTCCIENLDLKKLNFFVVRAYDTEGFESGNSNEVYYSNGPPASPGNLRIIPQGN